MTSIPGWQWPPSTKLTKGFKLQRFDRIAMLVLHVFKCNCSIVPWYYHCHLYLFDCQLSLSLSPQISSFMESYFQCRGDVGKKGSFDPPREFALKHDMQCILCIRCIMNIIFHTLLHIMTWLYLFILYMHHMHRREYLLWPCYPQLDLPPLSTLSPYFQLVAVAAHYTVTLQISHEYQN